MTFVNICYSPRPSSRTTLSAQFTTSFQQDPQQCSKGRWAAQALLQLAGGKNIGIEARESSRKAIASNLVS